MQEGEETRAAQLRAECDRLLAAHIALNARLGEESAERRAAQAALGAEAAKHEQEVTSQQQRIDALSTALEMRDVEVRELQLALAGAEAALEAQREQEVQTP